MSDETDQVSMWINNVRRYLSDYDLERVDWAEVASDLASK